MPIHSINGKNLFVESEGSGPVVLFVHGLGGSTTFYEAQARALASKHTVVRFDLEGHGRSGIGGTPSIASYAKDALGVLDALGHKEAAIVGHSMGTIVVQYLAANHADRVRKIALLGPVREQAPAGKEATRARAATVREKGMEAIATTVANAATSPTTQSGRPEIVGYVRELLLAQSKEGYALGCEALAAATAVDASKIAQPVLLLTGDDDKVGPPAATEAFGKELAQAQVKVLQGCGHWTAIEKAAEVTAALVAFL